MTVTHRSLQQAIYQTAVTAGLRKPTVLTESIIRGSIRHEVKITHGLKKFFITQLTNAKVDPARREYLGSWTEGRRNMGTTEMMLVYDRPTESNLLKDYFSAIDFLTIDESEKIATQNESLKQQLETATVTRKELENYRTEIKDLRTELMEMFNKHQGVPTKHMNSFIEWLTTKMKEGKTEELLKEFARPFNLDDNTPS